MTDYETLLRLARGRRSVRRFRPDAVPEAVVEQLLEVARWAPSAGNRQAHRFLLVTAPPTIAAMSEAVRAATARLAAGLRADLAEPGRAYLDNFTHFAEAPLVCVPIYRTGFDLRRAVAEGGATAPRDPAAPPAAETAHDALASVSAAIMSLLLAAHSLGLGGCWMTGPLCAAEALGALLEVPSGWSIAALVPLGYPDEEPAAPPRRELGRLVRRID
jgi:nitroreductase